MLYIPNITAIGLVVFDKAILMAMKVLHGI